MDAFPLTTIPMLAREGENWSTWSLCLLRILDAADPKLRGMVDGSYAEPIMTQGKEAQSHFDEYKHWQAVSEGAKAILRTGLSDATRQMTGAAPNYDNISARQLWLALESLYGQITMNNKMAMHVAFDALRQGDASLDDFFAEVARRSNRLAALAWPVEPHRILNVLSYGLHPTFAHWIPTFQTTAQNLTGDGTADAQTIQRVLTRIRQTETLLLQPTTAPPVGIISLPAIPHNATAVASSSLNGATSVCTCCNKTGHLKEVCKLNKGNKPNGAKPNAKVNAKANAQVKAETKAHQKANKKKKGPKAAAAQSAAAKNATDSTSQKTGDKVTDAKQPAK